MLLLAFPVPGSPLDASKRLGRASGRTLIPPAALLLQEHPILSHSDISLSISTKGQEQFVQVLCLCILFPQQSKEDHKHR